MLLFINLCSVLLIIVSILPLSRYAHWSVRVFDFPRVQKLVIAGILLVVYSVVGVNGATEIIMVTLLFVSMCYQIAWVFRYTFLSKVEVRRTEQVLSSQCTQHPLC